MPREPEAAQSGRQVKACVGESIEDQLRRRLEELQPAHDEYLRVRRALAAYMNEPSTPRGGGSLNDIGGLVVPLVLGSDDPMRPVDVRAALRDQGHEVTPEMVSNAMNYAARAGKLVRISRGLYASPGAEALRS